MTNPSDGATASRDDPALLKNARYDPDAFAGL